MSLFSELAHLADRLAIEPGRLKKRAEIVEAIRRTANVRAGEHEVFSAALADAGLLCLYLAGQPFPEADPRKLNTGGALLSGVLKEVSHCTDAALNAAYRKHGDLGAAAFEVLYATAPPTRTVTLAEVAEAFNALATARSTAARRAIVRGLLERMTAVEAKYLIKLMLADMRIGVKQSLIEEAIAEAASIEACPITPAAVRHAVMLEADLARSVVMAFAGTLAEARMRLFHPLGFMLASPVDTPLEAVERFTEKPEKPPKPKAKKKRKVKVDEVEDAGPALDKAEVLEQEAQPKASPVTPTHVDAFLEDKFDGMRAQLHCGDPSQPGRVALYSRNREDITHSFPELAEAFADVTTSLILDGEVLGWDVAAGQALPFAVLGQRIGRKAVDDAIREQVPVVFMAFDLLFDGDSLLLELPLRERRARLEAICAELGPNTASPLAAIPEEPLQGSMFAAPTSAPELVPRLRLSRTRLVENAEEIDAAYAEARARANEGVMLKAAGSLYLPGRRGLAWVKLKRTLDTLDVVITGAEYGHGRRAGLLSDYTFAVRAADGELLNVGKAYSGVTDDEILELTEWCKQHTLEDHGHFRTVEPLRVLEVAFNNVMRSTRHASGFALRFPRIITLRNDKPLDEIDTLARVEEIYQSQPDKPVERDSSG